MLEYPRDGHWAGRQSAVLRAPYGSMYLHDLLAVRSIIEPAIPDLRAGEAVRAIPEVLLGAAAPYGGPGVRAGTVLACFETHDPFIAYCGSRGVIDVLWLDGTSERIFRSAVATFDFGDTVCGICGFGLGDAEIHAPEGHHGRVARARHQRAQTAG